MIRSLVALAVIAALAFSAAGCSRSAAVQVRGIAPLHVNDAGESTPVKLRLYQLKRGDKFAAATVDEVWTNAAAALGDELVGDPTEVSILPGKAGDKPTVVELGKLPQGVSAIGILGLFRKPGAQDQRKTVVDLDEVGDTVVELTGYSVKLVAK